MYKVHTLPSHRSPPHLAWQAALNGQQVAIKVQDSSGSQGMSQFQQEVHVLGSCRHQVMHCTSSTTTAIPFPHPPHQSHSLAPLPPPMPQNLVPLLALSMEPGRPLCLVYPLMPHGSLDDLLAQPSSRQGCGATQRLRIAAEVAAGILYLHTAIPGAACGGAVCVAVVCM